MIPSSTLNGQSKVDYNQPICLQTHDICITCTMIYQLNYSIKDFNAQGLCLVKVCYVFVMDNLPHGLKKTSSTPVGFSMFGNSHYFWILFGATMNLNLCTVEGCALVWQTSVQLQCHTDNQWLQLEMSIHLAHSFIFSPAWKQHHKCLKGTLISSEGFISKQQMRGAFQINFRWTKLSEYRRSTSYW